MTDLLENEFKKEVQRKQDLIRNLASQEQNLNISIDNANKSIEDLNKKISDSQIIFNNIDSQLKAKNDEYDKHVEAVQRALNEREKNLNEKYDLLNKARDEHNSNMLIFQGREETFLKLKNHIVEELRILNSEICKSTNDFIEEIEKI